MAENYIKTETAEASMGEDGIVRFLVLPGMYENLAAAQENVAAIAKLCNGEKHPVLIDMTGSRGASREARIYYSRKVYGMSAAAMIISTPLSKFFGKFFLKLNKPSYPLQLFTSESEAIEWLKDFR